MRSKIQLFRRKIDEKAVAMLPDSLSPLLKRLYASRGIKSSKELERSFKGMLSWKQLSGIDKAVKMLYEALCKEIQIVIVGDFDADGAASTALSILSLKELGYHNIAYMVPNRFKHNYGLSPEIVNQAHANGAQMIMTVDNGISSHDGVERAHQLGIPVLITDHHLPSDTLPDAQVIINPNLHYCAFPSKSLSGVGVTFYLMLALRSFLHNLDWFKKRSIAIPNLAKYLDLVALGTVVDMVPLDVNNRILIWQGLIRIRSGICRPGIKALLNIANCNLKTLAENDLSYSLGPRLNAVGRLDDMSTGIALLLCENFYEAKKIAYKLNAINETRKKIEQKMQKEALKLCESLNFNNENEINKGLVIYHPNWHQGIIGILASRLKEQFHLPVIVFASAGNGILKGSGRSIQGMNIINILEQLNKLYPGLILKFGGHAMAAGLSLEERDFKKFQYCFNQLIKKGLYPALLRNKIISDGPLSSNEMTMEIAQMIRDAGPWGQMFPEPLFDGLFSIVHQKLIRKRHLKVMIRPIAGGPLLDGIVFNINTTDWPDNKIHKVKLTYKLSINEFSRKRNLQITINNIWPV